MGGSLVDARASLTLLVNASSPPGAAPIPAASIPPQPVPPLLEPPAATAWTAPGADQDEEGASPGADVEMELEDDAEEEVAVARGRPAGVKGVGAVRVKEEPAGMDAS